MRSGFNTNVRHRGTLFHVQTEDSGRANPHMITHLFYKGTILASEKQSYAEDAERDDIDETVKQRMETQHLGMLGRLRAGHLDVEISERLGADIFREAPEASGVEGSDTEPVLSSPAPEPPDQSGPAPRRRSSKLPADAPLDELVLDYLAERNARSPGAR